MGLNVRKLALRLSILGCVVAPATSLALGLGSLNVHSVLGQPLNADISLVGVKAQEARSIQVKIAPLRLFNQIGLPHPVYLDRLKFKMVFGPTRPPYVQVTTNRPVNQPFLDFLLEVSWSGGRLVREYTVLLNPPSFMRGKAEVAVHALAVGNSAAMVKPVGVASKQPGTGAPVLTSTYRARHGDTLYGIAGSRRPNPHVSLAQMMIALLRANPSAFRDHNINGLMQGYVLHIPSANQIKEIGIRQADVEVMKQNALWRQYVLRVAGRMLTQQATVTRSKTQPSIVPKSGQGRTVGGPHPAHAGSRLEILGTQTSHKTTSLSGVPGAASNEPGLQKLQKQIALTQETSLSNQQQISNLATRVSSLQAIMEKQLKLIQLKNQELASLQKALTKPPVGETKQPGNSHSLAQAATPQPAPPITSRSSASWLEYFLNNPNLLIAAGGVLLLLLALLWMIARRTKKPDDGVSKAEPLTTTASARGEPRIDEPSGMAEESSAATETDLPETGGESQVEKIEQEDAAPAEGVGSEEDEIEPFRQTDDVLAEADVYTAYGLYQQAEDVLKKGLEEHPERNDYRLKLLESYYATKNASAFKTEAQTLHDRLANPETDPLWKRAAVLGKELLPNHPLFAQVDTGGLTALKVPSGPADNDELDLGDLDLDRDEVSHLFDESNKAEVGVDGTADIMFPEPQKVVPDTGTDMQRMKEGQAATSKDELSTEVSELPDLEAVSQGNPENMASGMGVTEKEMTPPQQENQESLESLDFNFDDLDISPDFGDSLEKTAIETGHELDLDELPAASTSDQTEPLNLEITELPNGQPDKETEAESIEATVAAMSGAKDQQEESATIVTPADQREVDVEGERAAQTGIDTLVESQADKIAMQLDLSRAYVDMGDTEGAREALEEILAQGNDQQKLEAQSLLEKLS